MGKDDNELAAIVAGMLIKKKGKTAEKTQKVAAVKSNWRNR